MTKPEIKLLDPSCCEDIPPNASLLYRLESVEDLLSKPYHEAKVIMLDASHRYADWEISSILDIKAYYVRKIRQSLGITKRTHEIKVVEENRSWPIKGCVKKNILNASSYKIPKHVEIFQEQQEQQEQKEVTQKFCITGTVDEKTIIKKFEAFKELGELVQVSAFLTENIDGKTITESFDGHYEPATLCKIISTICKTMVAQSFLVNIEVELKIKNTNKYKKLSGENILQIDKLQRNFASSRK